MIFGSNLSQEKIILIQCESPGRSSPIKHQIQPNPRPTCAPRHVPTVTPSRSPASPRRRAGPLGKQGCLGGVLTQEV